MDDRYKQINHIILRAGRGIVLFILGGIAIHTFTMFFDYFLVSEPFHLNLHTNFIGSVFSVPMVPMMFVYGTLCLLIYFLWDRAKRYLFLVQQKEIQKENLELVFLTMQRITGLLAEHITIYNSEVLRWIKSKKARGHLVSERVEKPTQNIARALESLSELSFLLPYTDNNPENSEDIEKILSHKLDIIMNPKE